MSTGGVRRLKSRGAAGLIALTAAFVATVAYAASQPGVGVIGPSTGIQPTGRHLEPVGRLTPLGNLPTGGALTTNGRFLWALSTGRGKNDQTNKPNRSLKELWVYPLNKDFRRRLCQKSN